MMQPFFLHSLSSSMLTELSSLLTHGMGGGEEGVGLLEVSVTKCNKLILIPIHWLFLLSKRID